MDMKELQQHRARLLEHLGAIADVGALIDDEFQEVEHPRGTAHRSLKPKSGMYIVHHDQGFLAKYQDSSTGQWYEINLRKQAD